MTTNQEGLAVSASQALAYKLEGKSYDQIAKLMKVGKSTAFRWVTYARLVARDETINVDVNELIAQQFASTIHAGEIESTFLDEVQQKESIEPRDVAEVNKIKTSSQKLYSFLAGDNAKKDGGEKENPFSGLTTVELRKAMNE